MIHNCLMPMNVVVGLELDLTLYHSHEGLDAEKKGDREGSVVYTWHAEGRENWLSRGFSIVDVMGFVHLPPGLPDYIDMPSDP